jgi:predicted MFS family arabinose efflux permease
MRPVAYLRGLNPRLPRAVLTLQAGGVVNAFGNGLVLPFAFIYLTDVRGMDRATAGLILATGGFVALLVGPVSGTVSERFGAKRTLTGALVIQAVGYSLYAVVHHPWQAFLAAAVTGIGGGAFWPSQAALIARLTPPEASHTAWGMQRVAMNVGIGLGGLVGGFLAQGSGARGYQLIFLLDALTFVAYLCVVGTLPNPRGDGRREHAGSYRAVLRGRVLTAVLVANTVFITAGIAMFELLPAYVKHEAAVTPRQIGFIFLANTIFIGLAQLPVTQLLEGKRRASAAALMFGLCGIAWLCMPLAARLSGLDAALAVGALGLVFAVGECLHGGIQAPLVVDLAEPHLLERTMALSSTSWMIGFVIGPAVGGVVLQHAPSALWIGAGAILLAGGLAARALEPFLPERARRTPSRGDSSATAEVLPEPLGG